MDPLQDFSDDPKHHLRYHQLSMSWHCLGCRQAWRSIVPGRRIQQEGAMNVVHSNSQSSYCKDEFSSNRRSLFPNNLALITLSESRYIRPLTVFYTVPITFTRRVALREICRRHGSPRSKQILFGTTYRARSYIYRSHTLRPTATVCFSSSQQGCQPARCSLRLSSGSKKHISTADQFRQT